MAPILSCHPGSLNAFALKLKPSDSVHSIKARAARKLAIPLDGHDIRLKYLWADVFYTLDDDDDFDVFTSRHQHSPEVTLLLSSPHIPTQNPSIASVSSLPPSSAFSSSSVGARSRADPDASSLYSAQPAGAPAPLLYGRADARDLQRQTSMHLVPPPPGTGAGSVRSGRSARSRRSARSAGADTLGGKSKRGATAKGADGGAASVPEHKIKFEEFHNQLGVRTFIGSIGPVQNVRMMMKSGHRACYMSRAFAQAHNFIPRDAAPGFYGFSGITNLGTWPIKVGSKTVEQEVMLVESSYFPVILGRSFMERRGVRTDPLDQTSVVFMDTNEVIPTDLVVVKDKDGVVVPIS
ncbi:hypothetical protein JCM3770_005423 [Rhodotorula araucariae]